MILKRNPADLYTALNLSSKVGPLFFQVFKGEFQLPDFLKEQSQVQ